VTKAKRGIFGWSSFVSAVGASIQRGGAKVNGADRPILVRLWAISDPMNAQESFYPILIDV
jgi:hypothetical protein